MARMQPTPRYKHVLGLASHTSGENDVDVHGSYAALILHPKWKAKRQEILWRDRRCCVICASAIELQVHHRQYHFVYATNKFKDPWDYPDHLMITLCAICHSRGHSKYKVPIVKI